MDRDRDGMITSNDLILGVSVIMNKDVDTKEVLNVFKQYDSFGTGKISLQHFSLAIINGMLDNSMRDPTLTETFGTVSK